MDKYLKEYLANGSTKEREHTSERIELCRNCGGTGLADDAGLLTVRKVTCQVCKGSGRIDKTIRVNVTIKPYEPCRD